MSKKPDLSALFISGTNGIEFSYKEILEKASELIRKKNYFAGPALHKVYSDITGHSHLNFLEKNSSGNPVYTSKIDYKQLSDRVLKKLEELYRNTQKEKRLSDYLKEKVYPELKRGVDPETLADIGY